ncbi:MAG: FimV/HubP family polar landmark protein [Woeseiaceae bacterium]|nr:FimV/HubP family polar landmark protein [Woeseiaceae bacterium]
MSSRLLRMWLLPMMLLASQSWALGLGDIRLSSALNEPLRAEIELLAASPEELDNLRVQLASVETFERYDITRPVFLSGLQFRIMRTGTANGNRVLVTSDEPITEPFLTFLVEASWTRGRLLREYTVLLDPPTFAPPPVTQSTQAVTAPTRAAQTDSGRIERPAPQPPATQPPVQAPVPSPAAQVEEPSSFEPAAEPLAPVAEPLAPVEEPPFGEPDFATTAGGDVIVQRGDTLWSITSRVRPDSRLSMNQTMLAIFEANPQAFADNINIMRAGATLRIPSADEIFRISRGDALAEVQRQNAAWAGGPAAIGSDTQPSLTLLPPDEDVDLFDDGVDQDATDEPEQTFEDLVAADEARIDEIESLLADHEDSLIELTDNELAALRVELAELRGEEPPPPLPVEEPLDDEFEDPFVDDEDQLAADEFAEDELEPTAVDDDLLVDEDLVDDTQVADTAPEVEETVADAEDVATVEVVDTPPRRTSLVDTILGYVNSIWGIIGGALIVAVGLLVWFARRAGSGDEEDSTGMWESLEQDDMDEETLASTERLRALAKDDDSSIVVVEQETAPPRPAEEPFADTVAMADTEDTGGFAATVAETPQPQPDEDSPIEDSMMETFEMPAVDDQATSEFVAPDLDTSTVAEQPLGIGDADDDADDDFALAETAEVPAAETPADESLPNFSPDIEFDEPVEDEQVASMVDESRVAEISDDNLLDDTFHSDTAINLDQADPVAEADFHMAYGLYDQAADLINGAIEVEPERLDLLAKLCEIYFVWGNRDAFISAAGKLREATGGGSNEEWDKIVIMGQQIAGDHELFSGVSPAAATKAVDLSIEAGEGGGELDMDLESGDATQAVDLSFDAGAETGSGLDMDFESGSTGIFGDDADGASTAEMPAADSDSPTIEHEFDATDATGEMPAVSDDAEATEIADIFGDDTAEVPSSGPDATAEIDLDDLGLDLDGLDEAQMAGDDDIEDQISGLDDTSESQAIDDLTITGRNLALDEDSAASETGEMPAIEEPTDTNLALPEDKSIDDTDVEIDIGLLDATGQTQALSDDMMVDTGTSPALDDDDETMLASVGGDESTVLAPDVDIDFSKTQELDETGEMPAVGDDSLPDIGADDLTGILDEVQADDDHSAETAQMPHVTHSDIDPDAVDLNIGDDSPTMAAPADGTDDDSDEARTMTEVGTKLDLARAYVDMGDPSGARSILEEVLNEGDEGQRQQAQQLLESMPSS